jgi:hypothetical protein
MDATIPAGLHAGRFGSTLGLLRASPQADARRALETPTWASDLRRQVQSLQGQLAALDHIRQSEHQQTYDHSPEGRLASARKMIADSRAEKQADTPYGRNCQYLANAWKGGNAA